MNAEYVSLLPIWVERRILEYRNGKKSGSIKLNFNKGGIRNIERVEIEHPVVEERRPANDIRVQ